VLPIVLSAFFGGFALFMLGFSVFMHFEARKSGDNQFTVKLLPPPPRLNQEPPAAPAKEGLPAADWTAVPVDAARVRAAGARASSTLA
jgi:hypothetical protein